MSEVNYSEARIFRQTPSVYFADVWIEGQNGLDVVTHHGAAVSPPYDEAGRKQFYVHSYQIDYNRVLHGERVFELVYPDGTHAYVHLTPETGALEIPAGVYHRSVSCPSGSVLINQAVRSPGYSEATEFVPVAVDAEKEPVLWRGYMEPAKLYGDLSRILELTTIYDTPDGRL